MQLCRFGGGLSILSTISVYTVRDKVNDSALRIVKIVQTEQSDQINIIVSVVRLLNALAFFMRTA